jgi:hypothetical protein
MCLMSMTPMEFFVSSTAPIATLSFDETIAPSAAAVVDTRIVLRARETTARGV